MTKRAKILLIVAIVVWGLAMVYLLKPDMFSGTKALTSERDILKKRLEEVKTRKSTSQDITPDFIKKYEELCDKGISSPDPFTPYVIKGGKEDLNKLIMSSNMDIGYIKFGGYIQDKSGNTKIFLNIGGEKVTQSANELVDNRYMIIYVSSMGLIVLDVAKGGLYVIR